MNTQRPRAAFGVLVTPSAHALKNRPDLKRYAGAVGIINTFDEGFAMIYWKSMGLSSMWSLTDLDRAIAKADGKA